MRLRLLVGSVLLFSVIAPVMSQELHYDTTKTYIKYFKVPVTYYDYHITGSNPDFGFRVTERWERADSGYKNYSGWADSNLTADKSPKRSSKLWIANDTFLDISWNLAKLFKPWVAGVKDTFVWKTAPIITPANRTDTTIDTLIINGTDTIRYFTKYDTIAPAETLTTKDSIMISDTMFKNVTINDSLRIAWVSNDISYPDVTDSTWAFASQTKVDPIHSKGFGLESDTTDSINAGYTFCMHNKFTYHGGEQLVFGADDDGYVYINGKLVIECGGFHESIPVTLDLDSLNLTKEQKYDIDIFYVERRMGGNLYLGGIFDFDKKSVVRIDTLYDIVGVISPSPKSMFQNGTVLGLRVPPSSQNVKLEYFSMSGAKLMDRQMPLKQALVNQAVSLPRGMYLVRVTFLNAQGKRLLTGAFRKMIVKK
jgi:fibro-slime domain-containing protein